VKEVSLQASLRAVKEVHFRGKRGERSMSGTKPNRGERSERSNSKTLEKTACETSFFFHPLAQKYEFTPLLSSFTHSRKYARACVCNHLRMRGVVKEGNKRREPDIEPPRRQGWPTFTSLRWSGLVGQSQEIHATRGHTLARGVSAIVADPIGTST
jgi:hypothetical protein